MVRPVKVMMVSHVNAAKRYASLQQLSAAADPGLCIFALAHSRLPQLSQVDKPADCFCPAAEETAAVSKSDCRLQLWFGFGLLQLA